MKEQERNIQTERDAERWRQRGSQRERGRQRERDREREGDRRRQRERETETCLGSRARSVLMSQKQTEREIGRASCRERV